MRRHLSAAGAALILVLGAAGSAQAATFTVTSNDDFSDGTCDAAHCSLREAITAANGLAGPDEIDFDGATTLTPITQLPPITDRVTLNGTDAPDCAGDPENIVLDGAASFAGLIVTGFAAQFTRICAINVRGFGDGIVIDNADDVTVERCRIGTNLVGEAADPNSGAGIRVTNAADGAVIGGDAPGEGNLISGNGVGIQLDTLVFGAQIDGNVIGLDKDATDAIPNGTGIAMGAGADATIGADEPNVVSGNTGTGIQLERGRVVGNLIGTDGAGTTAVPNEVGVEITGALAELGGDTAGERNVISGNDDAGVVVTSGAPTITGNWIGPAADGTALGVQDDGIRVSAALTRIGEPGAGNVLASTGTQVVLLSGASTVVEGNLIGLLPDGVTAVGAETGVEVRSIASAARIGGTAPGAGNTIAGHTREGIETDANDTTIQGNTVGLNAAGAAAPNEDGIAVTADANDTLIGGTTPGARNIVSGNGRYGIAVEAGANTTIQGNWIGVGADGTSPRPNGGDGVYLDLFDPAVVGGVDPGAGNVIAHNGGDGIATDDTDDPALVLGNAIFANGGGAAGEIGIDLADNGVSANDPGDATAPQNFPLPATAQTDGTTTTVTGSIDAGAPKTVRVELFASASCDASGSGQGAVYLGAVTVAAGAGVTPFDATVAGTTPGHAITATASDEAAGATSEFSACLTAAQAPAPPPPPPPSAPPAPPVTGSAPLTGSPPPAPKFPAKLRVLRNGVDDGVLDMLVEITSRAVQPGAELEIDYHSSGRHTRFTVPIDGPQIKIRKRLPRTQPKDTGIVTVSYAGNAIVAPDELRLRAADGRSLLRRGTVELTGGVLTVDGTIADAARGVVRVRLGYDRPDGTKAFTTWKARIDDGEWGIEETLAGDALAGGHLSIQFTGYERAGLRGEATTKQVLPG